jgi:hypothetical protein
MFGSKGIVGFYEWNKPQDIDTVYQFKNPSTYEIQFLIKLDTISAGSVGIKIPVMPADSYDPYTSYALARYDPYINIQDSDIVGLTPSVHVSTGQPLGFNYALWDVSITNNFITLITTNAGQKSALSLSKTYWFGVMALNGSMSQKGWWSQIVRTKSVGDPGMNCRWIGGGPTYIANFNTDIYDYNI